VPNGRSGGFLIDRAELARLLEALPAMCEVGVPVISAYRARSSGVQPMHLSAAGMVAMLSAVEWNNVWIEEQDHHDYVIHLDQPVDKVDRLDGDKWIIVGPDSPLFIKLREVHARHRTPPK
jgi:hypothetical protein